MRQLHHVQAAMDSAPLNYATSLHSGKPLSRFRISMEYTDVLFRHKAGRALPGYWDWTPKQLAEIRAQYPDISDEDFKAAYWVCEGGCMFCGSPLTAEQRCSAPVRCALSFRLRTWLNE